MLDKFTYKDVVKIGVAIGIADGVGYFFSSIANKILWGAANRAMYKDFYKKNSKPYASYYNKRS